VLTTGRFCIVRTTLGRPKRSVAEVPPEQDQKCGVLQGSLGPDRSCIEGGQGETGYCKAEAAWYKKLGTTPVKQKHPTLPC